MKKQPYQNQILEHPDVKHRLAQLSIINRMRSKDQIEAHIIEKLSEQDSVVNVAEENWVKNSNRNAVQVLKHYHLFASIKTLKTEYIVDYIKKSNCVHNW